MKFVYANNSLLLCRIVGRAASLLFRPTPSFIRISSSTAAVESDFLHSSLTLPNWNVDCSKLTVLFRNNHPENVQICIPVIFESAIARIASIF